MIQPQKQRMANWNSTIILRDHLLSKRTPIVVPQLWPIPQLGFFWVQLRYGFFKFPTSASDTVSPVSTLMRLAGRSLPSSSSVLAAHAKGRKELNRGKEHQGFFKTKRKTCGCQHYGSWGPLGAPYFFPHKVLSVATNTPSGLYFSLCLDTMSWARHWVCSKSNHFCA